MPVSVATTRDPFRGVAAQPVETLRVPQARVLRALMPIDAADPPSEWPLLDRRALGLRAGFTCLSGSCTRALNGIRPGSSSGDAHLGLLARLLVEEVVILVDGAREVNYRATAAGVAAFHQFVAEGGKLPPVKDAGTCTNARYLEEEE